MTDRKVSTLDDLYCELDKSPDFRKADRRQKPLYDLLLEVLSRRKELGLTQKQLAVKAGTHQSAVSRIESAEHNPRLDTLIAIAEALDATLEIKLVPNFELDDERWQSLLKAEASLKEAGAQEYQETPTVAKILTRV